MEGFLLALLPLLLATLCLTSKCQYAELNNSEGKGDLNSVFLQNSENDIPFSRSYLRRDPGFRGVSVKCNGATDITELFEPPAQCFSDNKTWWEVSVSCFYRNVEQREQIVVVMCVGRCAWLRPHNLIHKEGPPGLSVVADGPSRWRSDDPSGTCTVGKMEMTFCIPSSSSQSPTSITTTTTTAPHARAAPTDTCTTTTDPLPPTVLVLVVVSVVAAAGVVVATVVTLRPCKHHRKASAAPPSSMVLWRPQPTFQSPAPPPRHMQSSRGDTHTQQTDGESIYDTLELESDQPKKYNVSEDEEDDFNIYESLNDLQIYDTVKEEDFNVYEDLGNLTHYEDVRNLAVKNEGENFAIYTDIVQKGVAYTPKRSPRAPRQVKWV